MEYRKPFMKKMELVTEYGLPEALLDRAYRAKGQTFAQKINPLGRNSPIVFDTAGFEKWRIADLKTQNEAILRG